MANQKKVSLLEFINPSRNYLTLMAALIVLASLAVSVGFGLTAANLSSGQRWLFVAFLILFPIVGLSISIWLILGHYRKLAVGENDNELAWRIMPPERQQRKLNSEIIELAELLGIEDTQLGDLRSAYIVAEDLALRNIEQESNCTLKRHINLDKTDFDAIQINEDTIKCIEVTFAIVSEIPQAKLDMMMRKADTFKRSLVKLRPNSKVILMVIIVTQLDSTGEAELRTRVKDQFTQTSVDVDIRFYDFEALQRNYAA